MIGTVLVQGGEPAASVTLITFIAFANVLIGRLEQLKQLRQTRFSKPAPSWWTSIRWKTPFKRTRRARQWPGRDQATSAVKVEFRNVSFGFANATSQGLHDISFTGEGRPDRCHRRARPAPARRRSSTCCSVSSTRKSGQILVDGHDITTVTRRSLRRYDRHRLPGRRPAEPLDQRQHPPRPRRCATGRR
jgi:ABC-type multidrug transport system fused ATPase/permease subunit